jgi:hypothetical protein
MTATTDRPSGVTAMAAVAAIAGLLDLLAGLGDIGMGGGIIGDLGFGETLDGIMTAIGVGLVLVGLLGLVTGYGLWQGSSWAWQVARLWAGLCIIVGLVGAGVELFGSTLTSEILATLLGSAVPAILAAVVLWYLYRPNVLAAFGRS